MPVHDDAVAIADAVCDDSVLADSAALLAELALRTLG